MTTPILQELHEAGVAFAAARERRITAIACARDEQLSWRVIGRALSISDKAAKGLYARARARGSA